MIQQKNWFEVDKNGLNEMFANFPAERMVAELVQNSWDCDKAKECKVVIMPNTGPGMKYTEVTVVDDNPDGFKNLQDAYTLFRSTDKREDPTKRGRYNLGEKIVLARAVNGLITTTTGAIEFDGEGRKNRPSLKTKSGSVVSIQFKKWSDKEVKTTLEFLQKLYVPEGINFHVQGKVVDYTPPMKVSKVKMATEYLKPDGSGNMVMTKTTRVTELWFYPKRFDQAHLYEMGLPVCEIDGRFDVNVQQKIPLSQDRTLVPQSYIQDIYAEMLMALGDLIEPGDLGETHIRTAMEDERIDPATCARLFKQQFGDKAVLDNPFDPDSNQEAARSGSTLVSTKTFGAAINSKLRQAGIQTSTESFCRDRGILEQTGLGMPEGFKEVKNESEAMINLRKYVQMMVENFYGKKNFTVCFANWAGNTAALYEHGNRITFNTMCTTKKHMEKPVSLLTATCLHELAHCMGNGHDGVYDREFEILVNKHTVLMATKPELYKQFEPDLFS